MRIHLGSDIAVQARRVPYWPGAGQLIKEWAEGKVLLSTLRFYQDPPAARECEILTLVAKLETTRQIVGVSVVGINADNSIRTDGITAVHPGVRRLHLGSKLFLAKLGGLSRMGFTGYSVLIDRSMEIMNAYCQAIMEWDSARDQSAARRNGRAYIQRRYYRSLHGGWRNAPLAEVSASIAEGGPRW